MGPGTKLYDEPASRLLIAAKQRGDDLHGLTQAVMRALWVEDLDISDRETLLAIARQFVSDPDILLSESERAEVGVEYDYYTDRAPDDGVFGSPYYIFESEPFWGQDRLDFLEELIIRTKASHDSQGRG